MLAERPKTLKAAKRMNFTKAALDELLRTRPQRQYTKWDTGSNHGLCVLVSRGPLHERRGTVTFRVCYYLPSKPGKPRYVVIGRYPDGEYKYPYKDDKG